MDLTKLINQLREEKQRLDQSILALEAIWREQREGSAPANRKGRKSMPQEEREAVSRRMKQYWDAWRKQHAQPTEKRAKPPKQPETPPTS
jgi:hypothetical protein